MGKHPYSLSTKAKGLRAIVHIEYTAGSKIITIRSDRVVKNNTSADLEVSLLRRNVRLIDIYPLPSGTYFPIPVDVEFDEISVRPTIGTYSWSLLKQGPEMQHGVMFCTGDTAANFWACTAVVPEDYEDNWLNLYAPCHFENLLPVPLTLELYSSTTKLVLLNHTMDPGETLDHFIFATKNLKDVVCSVSIEGYEESEHEYVTTSCSSCSSVHTCCSLLVIVVDVAVVVVVVVVAFVVLVVVMLSCVLCIPCCSIAPCTGVGVGADLCTHELTVTCSLNLRRPRQLQ